MRPQPLDPIIPAARPTTAAQAAVAVVVPDEEEAEGADLLPMRSLLVEAVGRGHVAAAAAIVAMAPQTVHDEAGVRRRQ